MNKIPVMNKLLLICLLFNVQFSILNIVGCKSQKEASASVTKTEEKQNTEAISSQRPKEEIVLTQNATKNKELISKNDSLFVTIERTVCFGKCPVYKAYIYTSGYVVYDGKQNVDKIGIFSTLLSNDEMALIEQRVKDVNYFDLNDKYDGPVTDLPSVKTSVAMNGYRKSITARYNVPVELKEFQKFIDQLFVEKNWILLGLPAEK